MWFTNRRDFPAKWFWPGRQWKTQIHFSKLFFPGDIISKKKKLFVQLGNIQSLEKASPVVSSSFLGTLSTGICEDKSSDTSKWTVHPQFSANLNTHLHIQEMKQLSTHFSAYTFPKLFYLCEPLSFERRSWFLSWRSGHDSWAQREAYVTQSKGWNPLQSIATTETTQNS